jgi:hypothetical protein
MTGYPEEFTHHYTDHLCPVGRFNTGQFFNGEQIGQIIHYSPEVIYPIGIWNEGMPRLSFSHLFGSPVMEPDIRDYIYNIFTMQLNNQPQ